MLTDLLSPYHWFKARRPAVVEMIIVVGLLLIPYSRAAHELAFFGDEVLSIDKSDAFKIFLRGDFHNPIWNFGYPTVTAPPITRYLVGVGRAVTPPDSEVQTMIDTRGAVWTARFSDRHDDMLFICRRPFVLVSALAGVLIFVFISLLGGPIAGWIWIALFALNPFFLGNLPMVMNEAPLLLFSATAALACVSLVEEQQVLFTQPRFFGKAAICGFFIGLAASSKINGAIGCGAAILSLLLGVIARVMRGKSVNFFSCLGAMVVVVGVSGITFVGLNPFLYQAPIGRMEAMLHHRTWRLSVQPHIFRESRVRNLYELKPYLTNMYSPIWGTIRCYGATQLNFFLSALGVGSLLAGLVRWVRGMSEDPAATVAIVWGCALAAPIFMSPLAWTRYFLFPVTVTQGSVAVAISLLLGFAFDYVYKRWIVRS